MPDGDGQPVASEGSDVLARRLLPLATRVAIAALCFFLLMYVLWLTR